MFSIRISSQILPSPALKNGRRTDRNTFSIIMYILDISATTAIGSQHRLSAGSTTVFLPQTWRQCAVVQPSYRSLDRHDSWRYEMFYFSREVDRGSDIPSGRQSMNICCKTICLNQQRLTKSEKCINEQAADWK